MVSSLASQQMLEILKETVSRNMIPRHLPPDTVVAHKIGGTWRVKADVGIAFLPRGPLLISIFIYYEPGERSSANRIAEIARAISERMQPVR